MRFPRATRLGTVDDRRLASRQSRVPRRRRRPVATTGSAWRPAFQRQQGARASSLVCPHTREDADVIGRPEFPRFSPPAGRRSRTGRTCSQTNWGLPERVEKRRLVRSRHITSYRGAVAFNAARRGVDSVGHRPSAIKRRPTARRCPTSAYARRRCPRGRPRSAPAIPIFRERSCRRSRSGRMHRRRRNGARGRRAGDRVRGEPATG